MNSQLIDLQPEHRTKLGTIIRDWIQVGLDQKGQPDWWKKVWAFYENRTPENPGKGLVPVHMPLSQPRIDMLSANVCTVVGKQDPIMLADSEDTELASKKQQFLHKVWEYAGFDAQIRKASTDAGNVNRCFYKLTPNGQPGTGGMQRAPNPSQKPGIEIAVISPNDMSVFPAVSGGCQGAVCVGNRLYKRVQTINDQIKAGEYYKVTVTGGDSPSEHDDTGTVAHSGSSEGLMPVENEQTSVECFDCIVKLNLKDYGGEDAEIRYRALIAFKNGDLLSLERYPENYQYTWYFEGFYITDGENYWSGRSVGRNLFTLQDLYNKYWAMFYTSGMSQAKPPIIGPKLDGEKYSEWEIGAYIESDEPVAPWSPSIRADLQPIIIALQNIERVADQVARVSQNSMGAANKAAETASENNIIASGVAVGLEEYIANFSSPFPAMAEHTEHLMQGMWEDVQSYYTQIAEVPVLDPTGQPALDPATNQPMTQPGEVPIISLEEIQRPVCWKVNGTSPASLPQTKLRDSQMLATLAQDPEYGIDKHALGTLIITNSSLSGDGNLQLSREEIQANLMAQQQAQMQQLAMQQQHESGMANQKREADIEREHVKSRLGRESEASGKLVELLGEEGVNELLRIAQKQSDRKAS